MRRRRDHFLLPGAASRKMLRSLLSRPHAHVQTVAELESVLWHVLRVGGYGRDEIHAWLLRAARSVDRKVAECMAHPLAEVTTSLNRACKLLCASSPAWFYPPEVQSFVGDDG